ncbi:MAG: lamin tail domain-containing protein [Myxococcota bacterium]
MRRLYVALLGMTAGMTVGAAGACDTTSDPRDAADSTGSAGTGSAVSGTPPPTISASASADATVGPNDGDPDGDPDGGTTMADTMGVDDSTGRPSGTTTAGAATTGTGDTTATTNAGSGSGSESGTTAESASGSDASSDTGVEAGGLVINEVGYNDPGGDTDGLEFVEIYNASGGSVALPGIELYFVNGSSGDTYGPGDPVDLSAAGASLPDDAYLVVADDPAALGVVASASVLVIDLGGDGNVLQNGDPDGLLLYDTDTDLVLDSLVYAGTPFVASDIDGQLDTLQVGEGVMAGPTDPGMSLTDAIGRDAASTDTDDNSADFAVIDVASPGAMN